MTEQPFTYQPPKWFSASFEGFSTTGEIVGNTVTVQAIGHYDAGFDGEVTEADETYADYGAARHLVKIDTNYKPSRPGEHPVRLTRPDAVKLAAAVLAATEDTFACSRYGQLRPAQAAELLQALVEVDYHLAEIREHALSDLIDGTNLADQAPTEAAPAPPHTDATHHDES